VRESDARASPAASLLFFLYPSPSLSALTDDARDRATAAAAADATGGGWRRHGTSRRSSRAAGAARGAVEGHRDGALWPEPKTTRRRYIALGFPRGVRGRRWW
jgi:hypothetical protein